MSNKQKDSTKFNGKKLFKRLLRNTLTIFIYILLSYGLSALLEMINPQLSRGFIPLILVILFLPLMFFTHLWGGASSDVDDNILIILFGLLAWIVIWAIYKLLSLIIRD